MTTGTLMGRRATGWVRSIRTRSPARSTEPRPPPRESCSSASVRSPDAGRSSTRRTSKPFQPGDHENWYQPSDLGVPYGPSSRDDHTDERDGHQDSWGEEGDGDHPATVDPDDAKPTPTAAGRPPATRPGR